MFVSSYMTYVHSNSSEKNAKEKLEANRDSYSRFENKASLFETKTPQSLLSLAKELPLDYVSNYKVINNQQKLLKESESSPQEKSKFTKISTLQKAQNAYLHNSTLFSLFKQPKPTIDQTPYLDSSLPDELFSAHQNILKEKMLNAYIANDNYYKITA